MLNAEARIPNSFAISVVRDLTAAGYIAYWAGGCVRDLLREVEANDYDVATNARPEEVRNLFGARRTLAVGESFGVIIVLGARGTDEKIEVATFREEGDYQDGRRPGRVSFCTPEEDARRRDFTINGMFYDPLTETVHDFVGGQLDLQRRVVRAIGNPHDRMTEDKLRMLRAVRFATVLDFELDPATAQAVLEMASQVTIVSAERIAQELRKILAHRNRSRAMRLFEELHLLPPLLPETVDSSMAVPGRWKQLLEVLEILPSGEFATAFAVLVRDVPSTSNKKVKGQPNAGTVSAACGRLKLSNEETDAILWLTAHKGGLEELPSLPVAHLKRFAIQPLWGELFQLERAVANVERRSDTPYQTIEQTLSAMPPEELNPAPFLTGADLLALGFKSGPQFKLWLHTVRDAQLNGELQDQAAALLYVQQLAMGSNTETRRHGEMQ